MPGHFLLKDLVLIGVSTWALGDAPEARKSLRAQPSTVLVN
jgi:hypothetical protein